MAILKLKSSCGQRFEVEETVAMQSITIKNLVEDGYSGEEIPLSLVDGPTLAKVLEWCMQHAVSDKTKEEVGEWEKNFVTSFNTDILYDVLMASNYLNIPALLNRLCQQTADLITGKSPEEIRRIFKIKNDFSPEEEEEIKKQSCWAFE